MFQLQRTSLFILFLFVSSLVQAQQDDGTLLSLEDMSGFRGQAGNWSIVGDVTMDPSVDVHQKKEEKKSKRKKKGAEAPRAVTYEPGTGILLNMNSADKKDHLVTNWKHGDIELEMEIMLPKGSNSGIYLQGRYEVQLFDSWGVKAPSFSDIGGIYRNWEVDPEKIYMGKAPLSNAAKAPGLWQKLKIAFKAPKFDENGNKIENARILSVELNGVVIHENVEIPRPTGGPLVNNEVPEGPLMIQGDHGAVAFRNIRYQRMKESTVKLSDLKYNEFLGKFQSEEEMRAAPVAASGVVPLLTYEVTKAKNDFGLQFLGTLTVPEEGDYTFELIFNGDGIVRVDGKEVLSGWRITSGTTHLAAGSYPIEIVVFKISSWLDPRLGLSISSESMYSKTFHTFNSAPPDSEVVSPIFLQVGSEPKLLRAFLDFKGLSSRRLTHTIGVGSPEGIHYVYDLNAGNIACVWRGDFVDATPMWNDRGDGSFTPRGMVQYLFTDPTLAVLSDTQSPFPEKSGERFKSRGYVIEASGRPVFLYTSDGMEVTDKIYPDEKSRSFVREITIKGAKPSAYLKLAEGSKIELLSGGRYAIDDKQYYIRVATAHQPMIRQVKDKEELIVPANDSTLTYSIIW